MKARAPQLHLEYRFYRTLGNAGGWIYICTCTYIRLNLCMYMYTVNIYFILFMHVCTLYVHITYTVHCMLFLLITILHTKHFNYTIHVHSM